MDKDQDGAGAERPEQDAALVALASLLEAIGDEASVAFMGSTEADDRGFTDCAERAETVVRCIVNLPATSLQGASAKVRAVRATGSTVLLRRDLVDALASDMHADVTRLRAEKEGAGHA